MGITSNFCKVGKYKVSIQKPIVFLYTNNKTSEKEINKIILFTIASKLIIYQRINLTNEVKDLYSENHRSYWKKSNKTQTTGKKSCVHESEVLVSLKCPCYPKQSIDSNQSPSNYQQHHSQK